MSALGRNQTLPRSIAMSAPGALSCVRANLNYSALCGVKEDRSNDASVEGETEDSKQQHHGAKDHFLFHGHLPELCSCSGPPISHLPTH